MEEAYKQLAERNNWDYSIIDNRPYFMKNGKYAIPDESTSEADKEFLAEIISEGSEEMAKLIVICWDNNIKISGPCSGIREFHNEPPTCLHFAMIGKKEMIDSVYENLQTNLPDFHFMYREQGEEIRLDISYFLKEKDLTKTEADAMFLLIRQQLEKELEKGKETVR